jgi:hypothetical protein
MYLNANKMIYLIVGDAETQLKKTGVVLEHRFFEHTCSEIIRF